MPSFEGRPSTTSWSVSSAASSRPSASSLLQAKATAAGSPRQHGDAAPRLRRARLDHGSLSPSWRSLTAGGTSEGPPPPTLHTYLVVSGGRPSMARMKELEERLTKLT